MVRILINFLREGKLKKKRGKRSLLDSPEKSRDLQKKKHGVVHNRMMLNTKRISSLTQWLIPLRRSLSKSSKPLEDLMIDMSRMSTGDMTSLTIERARADEKMVAIFKNLKRTYKRYIREAAGVQTAAATELAKRVNASSNLAELEQENIQLRVKLYELENGLAKVLTFSGNQ